LSSAPYSETNTLFVRPLVRGTMFHTHTDK
jgi:hypothetical protein